MSDIRKAALMKLRQEMMGKVNPLNRSQMAQSFEQEQGRAPSDEELAEYNERIQPRGMKAFNERRLAEIMAQLPAEQQAEQAVQMKEAKRVADHEQGMKDAERTGYFSGAWDENLPANPSPSPIGQADEIDPDLVAASEKAWNKEPYTAEQGRQAAAIQTGITKQSPGLKKLVDRFRSK